MQMPELVVDFITSLDGYASAEGWPGWWGMEGPEYLAWLGENPEGDYLVLMGANTYRLMYGFTKEGEPGTDVLGGLSKVVFSSTLTEPLEWENSTLVTGDAADAVREMKETGDRSMRTIGSVTLCRSLLVAGLVDRFRVVMFPVITGATGQERIYDGYPDVALDMVDSRTFDGQIQLTLRTCRGCYTGQPARPERPSCKSSGPQTIMAMRPTRRDDSGSTGGAITLAALAAI